MIPWFNERRVVVILLVWLFLFLHESECRCSKDLFMSFVEKYNKAYSTPEEWQFRHSVFCDNVEFIETHNADRTNTFTLSINKFADLTHEEYQQQILGLPRHIKRGTITNYAYHTDSLYLLPPSIDWREDGIVGPVMDPIDCPYSDYAIAAIGSLQSLYSSRVAGEFVALSVQQVVDCSGNAGNLGCNGGLPSSAFEYLIAAGGSYSNTSYPWIDGENPSCLANSSKVSSPVTCTLGNYTSLPEGNETALQVAVALIGPVVVAVDASQRSFTFYKGGVYYSSSCSSTLVNRYMLVVGYGVAYDVRYNPANDTFDSVFQDYWIVQNDMGPDWGEDGYILMSRNQGNNCGIATDAIYPFDIAAAH